MNGVLLVDKPSGMTSHDVIDRIRPIANTRRVGHAGTLDPMATGMLVVCIGGATRIVQFLTGLTKDYSGCITLGACSSTYDAEGAIVEQSQPLPERQSEIEAAMASQLGTSTQLAPPFSAVKVKGKKLYEYARQGEEVPQKHRQVQIFHFDLLDYEQPNIQFQAKVGSGTYIRSMAHDLGAHLGCGGYLAELRREAVGSFRVQDAIPLDELCHDPALLPSLLMTTSQALPHLPKIIVGPDTQATILHGRGFTTRDILSCETLPLASETALVTNSQGEALSIVRGEPAQGDEGELENILFFRPVRVLGQSQAA